MTLCPKIHVKSDVANGLTIWIHSITFGLSFPCLVPGNFLGLLCQFATEQNGYVLR